jgi:subtilisin family serine protease
VRVTVFAAASNAPHAELAQAFAGGWDFVNGDDDPADDNGHGTHVSGTVAAADDRNLSITARKRLWLA